MTVDPGDFVDGSAVIRGSAVVGQFRRRQPISVERESPDGASVSVELYLTYLTKAEVEKVCEDSGSPLFCRVLTMMQELADEDLLPQ